MTTTEPHAAGPPDAPDTNPFVGPRPLREGEPIHGRQRELDALTDQLYAERLVLLHAPSGAGKSSLVAAGLIPRLRRHFHILPTVRVNQAPPSHSRRRLPGRPPNTRYGWSALESLEGDAPTLPEGALLDTPMADYLAHRPRPADAPPRTLLIFDQFEEILTTDTADGSEKHRFFDALATVLEDDTRWALFMARDEAIGPLAEYRAQLPMGLRSTFRLDGLDHRAAREAMARPALDAGRPFTPDALDRLVDDLARIHVQRPDGSVHTGVGPTVEPVQLQVVCRQLWETMTTSDAEGADRSIDLEDVERFGDVGRALGTYYDHAAHAIAGDPSTERRLREWIGDRLLVGGLRGQVLRGPHQGLPQDLVDGLRNRHLVRAEERAGKTWFELAHDRLIEPVQASNRRWFETRLHPVQQQARLWARQGRPSGLRLTGDDLMAAETWAATADLTDDTRDFLEASRRARRHLEELQALRRRAEDARDRAEGLARAATANALLAAGEVTWGSLFALEVEHPESTPTAVAALERAVSMRPDRPIVLAHGAPSEGAKARDAVTLYAASLSPDDRWAVTASGDGTARLWDAATGRERHRLSHPDAVYGAVWSPDGRQVLTLCADRAARTWDASTGAVLQEFQGACGHHFVGAWAPNGRHVATENGFTAEIFDVERGIHLHTLDATQTRGLRGAVRTLAWSPDGQRLATGSFDHTARIWNARDGRCELVLTGHTAVVSTVRWSLDGTRLLTASADGTVRLWSVAEDTPADRREEFCLPPVADAGGEPEPVLAAAGSPDGYHVGVVTASTLRIWHAAVLARPITCEAMDTPFTSMAWAPDSTRLLTTDTGRQIHLWDAASGSCVDSLPPHDDTILSGWDHTGRCILSYCNDGVARLWSVQAPRHVQTLVQRPQNPRLPDMSPGPSRDDDSHHVLIPHRDGVAHLRATGPVEYLQARLRASTRHNLPPSLRREKLGESQDDALRHHAVRDACTQDFFEALDGVETDDVTAHIEAWRRYQSDSRSESS